MPSPSYRLELLVLEEAKAYYAATGTRESLSGENAGYDLKVVTPQGYLANATIVPLGVKARMVRLLDDGSEEECHFSLEPRSSIFKYNYMMANGRGVIDRSYRGQLMVPLISVGEKGIRYSMDAGTRLFQIVAPDMGYIREVVYVDSLSTTVRGEGGFGSTGTK